MRKEDLVKMQSLLGEKVTVCFKMGSSADTHTHTHTHTHKSHKYIILIHILNFYFQV